MGIPVPDTFFLSYLKKYSYKMPPKFHPKNRPFAKLTSKSFPPQISQPGPSQESSSSSGLEQEAEDKFELELCWCVQQLELSLQSGKLPEKHLKNTQKSLNLLKSNTAPLIQKRQIMRNTFGDYRDKMLQEEKKHSKTISTARFSTQKMKVHKSVFVRKAHSNKNCLQQIESDSNGCTSNDHNEQISAEVPSIKLSSLFNNNTSNDPFVFNFSHPD